MSSQFDQPSSLWQPLGNGVHSTVWRTRKSVASVPRSFDDSIKEKDATKNIADELSEWVAVKAVYDNSTMPPHDIVREAAILKRVSHPNIISLLSFVQGGLNAPYVIYMPLIPVPLTVLLSSPLFTPYPLLGPYSALSQPVFASHAGSDEVSLFCVVVKSLVYQLILALAYLHTLDPPVAHRDVKPGNVLVDHQGVVKLIDFGIAWSTQHIQNTSEATRVPEYSKRHRFDGWAETEEKMCCEVATGPYRAPELLFSPPTYSAVATDLWSLGTTISQFFTPLRLVPSYSLVSSPSSSASDEEEYLITKPFLISPNLKAKIDYRATWERLSLFNGNRGELGLAWSIFKLRGTPNEDTWPAFNSLPDANKIEFEKTSCKPLRTALPHLPLSWIHANTIESASTTNFKRDGESPLSLIAAFLAYQPTSRLSAAEALSHPWFSADTLLPLTYPGLDSVKGPSFNDRDGKQRTHWAGRTLGGWLEPIIKRETAKLTSHEASNP